MKLSGRAALVTGGGQRVGRAIALALGRAGMRVAIHYHESQAGAEETRQALEQVGAASVIISADLSDAASAARLVEQASGHWGGLDVLVNSAAVMQRTPLGEITGEGWDSIMNLNLRAPLLLSQAAAPHLREARGAIVNIADLSAYEIWPGYLAHGVSKAGLVYLTRALARILAPEVRVTGIAPGTVLLPEGWTAADAARQRGTTPLQRLGSPDDVTGALMFLLESDYVTGEVVVVDGGRLVR